MVVQNRKTSQLHIVKAISLVWCTGLWQSALIFQLSGTKGLPSARQLKILYSVCVWARAYVACVSFACVCAHLDKHTRPGLWFSWKFQRELLTPGEALKWSIKSLWSLSTARSSNRHHLSAAIRQVAWQPVKPCDLLFKVTLRRNRNAAHMTEISGVLPSQGRAHAQNQTKQKCAFCVLVKKCQHFRLCLEWLYSKHTLNAVCRLFFIFIFLYVGESQMDLSKENISEISRHPTSPN